MTEVTAHKAALGTPSVDQRVLRTLARIARLQTALATASEDRSASLQAELDALDASFGGTRVREAMQSALADELERTAPEREKSTRAALRAHLQKQLSDLGDE